MLTAWVSTLGLIYWGRFLQGRWRHMRVIEPEIADATTPAGPLLDLEEAAG